MPENKGNKKAKEIDKLFQFPELPDSQYNGGGYRGYIKRFFEDFLGEDISWGNVLVHLEENLRSLEGLLIERSRTSGPVEKLEREVSRLNTVIIGYFSKIWLSASDSLSKTVRSKRANPGRVVRLIKKLFRLKTMYEPLYKVPAKKIPSQYSERFKELIQRYLLIKERFESGAYIL